jgi:type IV pilus assembly protein PilB
MARKKLGEMLVEAGVLSEANLRAALAEQRKWGGTLGRMLVEMRLCTEAQLVDVLSRQLVMEQIDLDAIQIPQPVLDLIPSELATQYHIVPFAQPMKFLDVAMSDPTNLGIIDELRIRTQLNIRPYLAGPKMIERALVKYYGRRQTMRITPITGEPDAADRSAGAAVAAGVVGAPDTRDAEIAALQARLSELEANVARDEEVLRKLLALLVEKKVATRDEILDRIK